MSLNRFLQILNDVRVYPFSTYTKLPEKLTFLTSSTHTYVYVSGGKKC